MTSHLRSELVEPLIAAGKELFTDAAVRRPAGVPRYNVLGWLFDVCAETGTALNMFEREHVVEEVLAAANQTIASHSRYMTVGELREKLRNLPENMPVYYQRIEDMYFDKMHWTSHRFIGESRPADDHDRLAAASGDYPLFRVVQGAEGDVAQEMLEGLSAFTGFVCEDEQGRKAFIITAHY